MHLRQLFAAAALALVATPAATLELEAGVGRARVATDPFNLLLPALPGIDSAPGFARDVTVLAAGARFDLLLVVPVSVSVFASDTARFQQSYSLGPMLPAEVVLDHAVRTRGARVAFAPAIPLGNGWELDAALGLQFTQHRVTTAQDGVPDATFDSVGPYGGVGVTWWPLPVLGFRAGADLAENYEAFTIGVRIGF